MRKKKEKKFKEKLYKYSYVVPIVLLFFYMVLVSLFSRNIGQLSIDLEAQHVTFVDYIRKTFEVTNNFFPQFSLNYGLGQSFATLYYHGMYNPFIVFSFLVPFIPTNLWLNIVFLSIIGLNGYFTTKILEKWEIKKEIIFLVVIILGFIPGILSNFAIHFMYIYYIPFIFMCIYAFHHFDSKKGFILYFVGLLGITFTNYVMLVSSVIAICLYILVLSLEHKLKLKKAFFINFIFISFCAMLVSFFIIIPQAEILIQGARSGNNEIRLLSFFNRIKMYNYPFTLYSLDSVIPNFMYLLMPFIFYELVKRKRYIYIGILFFAFSQIFWQIN
ncbi:MAG: hypothetical protein ACRCUP_05955, partial [Mycoplasmatales bacterium]